VNKIPEHMKNIVLFIAIAMLGGSFARAENLISQVKEGISQAKEENAVIEKIEAIKNKSTWKGDDCWFYNIAKEREGRFLIQKVKIIPQKSLSDAPHIVTLSIHVDSSGSITDEKIDYFAFPVDTSMGRYLDKGIISRDRGGLIGAAVGSVPEGCSGDLVPTNLCDDLAANVFPKFYEWENIAQEKNVGPFTKYFDGRKFYDTWDPQRGMTNIVEAHGSGGEIIEKDEYNKLKQARMNELENLISEHAKGLAQHIISEANNSGAIRRKGYYNPELGNNQLMETNQIAYKKIVDDLTTKEEKWAKEQRDSLDGKLYYEAKNKGIIHFDPYVPAVTGRDPSFEQTGWVFVWKGSNAYAYKIQNQNDYTALIAQLVGGKNEEALASLTGNILLSREHMDGFQVGYNFLKTLRNDASKYVSEYAAIQSKQSSQQDELFK